MSDDYQVPDLSSILRTLSAYVPATLHQAPITDYQEHDNHQQNSYEEEYDPSQSYVHLNPHASSFSASRSEDTQSNHVSQPNGLMRPPPNPSPAPIALPKIDPTTILDWSAGLRFATKLFATNEQSGNRVRKMIAGEQEHVKQWWAGREALLKKQENRIAGKLQLEEVLRSVGGQVSSTTVGNDDVAELKRYDTKVYKAQNDMVEAMRTDLAAMGVPFFGTKSHLIKLPIESATDGVTSASSSESDTKDASITKAELLSLQKRMLQFLEDMFND